MNANKVKFKKHKVTDSENILKRKHDETRALMDQMNQKALSEAELEKQRERARKLARMAALKQQQQMRLNQDVGSRENSAEGSYQTAGGDIHNSINLTVNYNINQSNSLETINRRKRTVSTKGKKTRKQREIEAMNTSLSKMLDKQLLQGNDVVDDGTKKVQNNVSGSLTNQIFKGDKIYLKDGAMAFKPLGMETVLEQDEAVNASFYNKSRKQKLMAPKTTEQNIAMQHRLDFSSAEDFISMPRAALMDLSIKEEQYKPPRSQLSHVANKGGDTRVQSRLVSQKSSAMNLGTPGKAFENRKQSKSSLKTISPTKRAIPDEGRMDHPGLLQMEYRLKAQTTGGQNTPMPYSNNDIISNISGSAERPTVKFNDHQAINHRANGIQSVLSRQESSESLISGGHSELAQIKRVDIAQGLYRQTTKNNKQIARQMRTDRHNEETGQVHQNEKLAVDIVLEKPMPMPHRLKSNATFQPKSQKALEQQQTDQQDKNSVVHDDNVSQLAIDYNMHLQNQQRLQNLMALLGKGGKYQDIDLSNIDIGESMSQADAMSQHTVVKQNNQKLPSINTRMQDLASVTDDPRSTQVGTNVRGSAMNLAEYTKRKLLNDQSSNARLGLGGFDSSLEATSQGQGIDPSILDKLDVNSESNIAHSKYDPIANSISGNRKMTLEQEEAAKIAFRNRKGGNFTNKRSLENLSNIHFIHNVQNQELSLRNSSSLDPLAGLQKSTDLSGRSRYQVNASVDVGGIRRKHNSKYQKVRSSMFNKNPIFDQMDVHIMSEKGDGDRMSEYSVGGAPRSNYTRRLGVQNDQLQLIQQRPEHLATNEDAQSDYQSVRTLNVRSMSTKKLRPINYVKSQLERDRNPMKAQSLQFNQGLSYVMVKGKVQPSEKYIYKKMLPYTNAQQFQSVQVKSSVNRNYLVLQQGPQTAIPTKSQGASAKNTTGKSKKLKGSKMTRTDNQIDQRQLQQSAMSTQNRKKGVIMEMEEEYSGSDNGGSRLGLLGGGAVDNKATWQDMEVENNQLKDQILNQIAIFEQYLKVATLQHKARQIADEEDAKRLGQRHKSTDIFKGKDFEFEDKKLEKQFLKATSKHLRNKTQPKKQQQAVMSSIQTSKKSAIIKQHTQTPANNSAASSKAISRQQSAKKLGAGRSPHSIRGSSPIRLSQAKLKVTNQHSRGNSSDSEQVATYSPSRIVNKLGEVKATFKYMSKKVTPFKMKQLEKIQPMNGDKLLGSIQTHKAHQVWIEKIDKLWKRLNRNRNPEVVRIQNEIKRNKANINELMRGNLFELDVNSCDQKMLLDVKTYHKQINKKIKKNPDQKKVIEVQKLIRDELARKADFDTWGFHNHIIEYRLKVRMTEDVIDCAQRLQVKPDARTQKELSLLQMLRDRTYDDINYFVEEREKKHWRLWDRYGGRYYKPHMENRNLTYKQLNERVEIHLHILAFLEPMYSQLVSDIPPYNAMNSEMIQFATTVFGNEGWLQMFQIRQLRKIQDKEQHEKQFMPPVDQIKKLEVDPYTLQVESESEPEIGEIEVANQEPQQDDETPEEKKQPFKSWWVRKPDKHENNPNLKTGYEPIIAKRKQEQHRQSIKTNQINVGDVDSDESPRGMQSSIKRGSMYTNANGQQPLQSQLGLYDNDDAKSFVAKSEVPQGYGVHKFEGDVVQHIKDMGTEIQKQEKIEEDVQAIKKSSWLQVLEKEREQKAERDAAERRARAGRLAILFEEEDVLSQDDEDLLDAGAAKQDVRNYMEKIDTHLQVEKRLLEAWNENDAVQEGGPRESVKN